jgi:signal transduction histidine kinase
MKILTYLIVVCTVFCVNAQDSAFKTSQPHNFLYQFATFATTGNREVSLQNLKSLDLQFSPLDSENQSIGFTTDNYWLKFKIVHDSKTDESFYLETARPVTDVVNLFLIKDLDTLLFKSGDQISFYERQVQHRSTIFKLDLESNAQYDVIIHYKSDGETLNLPLNLFTEDEFWRTNYVQQLFLGLFYGLLFLAGLIYLFFYPSLREKTFLYYGIYVFSIALMQAALDGFIFQYFFPQGGYINDRSVMIAALFSNLFLLKYSEYFLKVNNKAKFFKVAFNVIYWIIAALGVIILMKDNIRAVAYPLANINGLISLLLILSTLAYMYYKNLKVDKFFSIGIFFLVIGLLGFVMNNLSLLPNNFLVLNSAKFGTAFEVIFLSLSMTNLIRDLRLEKERSQSMALKKSKEISDLKTYFMSNMSHELRTPINAIMGIAESQLSESKDPESIKNFEIIKHASISLLSNINDILDFEKIEKKQLKLRPETFDLSLALKQISDNWKVMAEKKGLNYLYKCDVQTLPYKVHGDYERFIQISNNILSNAVKFTQSGTITFEVNPIKNANNMCHISLRVSDTGIGMSAEKQESLFDSFSQMKLDDKRSFGGIGLGLTIVRHLVELFEGHINIESEHGRGTIISIELPLKIDTVEKPKLQFSAALESSSNRDLNFLIVEDNVMNQLIMKKMLGAFPNFKFKVAANGKIAIEMLMNEGFDVVLMDLQMPVMDGYEATSIIRKGEIGTELQNIPIIAVTADATEKARQKVFECGMTDYITKPVKKELLLEKIDKLTVPYLKVV